MTDAVNSGEIQIFDHGVIHLTGDLENVDIVSDYEECKRDLCEISDPDKMDDEFLLAPDNGGCEVKCIDTKVFPNVECACGSNPKLSLRQDHKTCVLRNYDTSGFGKNFSIYFSG